MEKHNNIISVLNSAVSVAGRSPSTYLILYTSFGVVRGRSSLSAIPLSDDGAETLRGQAVELTDVTLEHYSSHLPTASFAQFYVRLSDVLGVALEN